MANEPHITRAARVLVPALFCVPSSQIWRCPRAAMNIVATASTADKVTMKILVTDSFIANAVYTNNRL